MADTLRQCREILGESCDVGTDAHLLHKGAAMLDVLLSFTKYLCEKATGPQDLVTKFLLIHGADALFGGIDVDSRTLRAVVPDVDEVMKRINQLRRSAGFRKLLADVQHGVIVEQDIDWIMVPLLRDIVSALDEMRTLLAANPIE